MGIEAAVIGGSIGSALIGASSSRSAARAQSRASDAAIAEQQRQFDTILDLTAPQRAVSNQAMNAIAQILGLPGFTPEPSQDNASLNALMESDSTLARLIGGAIGQNTSIDAQSDIGDFDASLVNIPGNEVIVDDMMRRIRQSSPTTGGNVLTALADRVSGFQSDRLFNSLFGLAGLGAPGTSIAAQGAGNTGNAVSSLLQSSGIANASGILGQGQAINSGLQNVLQFFALRDMLGNATNPVLT